MSPVRELLCSVLILASAGCGRTGLVVLEGCESGLDTHCMGELFLTCDGSEPPRDCSAEDMTCHPDAGCVLCEPGEPFCRGPNVVRCADDGASFEIIEECDLSAGFACRDAACVNLCDEAREQPSQMGCEHWSVDLDNGDTASDAASERPFGVIVANPWTVPVTVRVEANDGAFGETPRIVEVLTVLVPPLDHEVIELPRREVDGSDGGRETHTAVTSNAYRIETLLPVTIVQMNPLDAEGFSGDGSLLLPTEMLGERTTVVGWPQTIANGEEPELDFDPAREDEDLRAFLTVVGVTPATTVRVTLGSLGPEPAQVVAGGPVPALGSGDVFEIQLGRFDVLNLETRGLNADFTGSVVEADAPVVVFVGSEASDVPRFDTYSERRCCADHLEEQLLPDRHAGQHFIIGRQHSRRQALARARGVSAPDIVEPEWVRLLAVTDASIESELSAIPSSLSTGESVIVRTERSFEIRVTNTEGRLHVLSALIGQDGLGVPSLLLGGDPSIILVPPVGTFSRTTEFAVPERFAFDFVTVLAPSEASVTFDRMPLEDLRAPSGEPACTSERASPSWLVHQCQISFPRIREALVIVDEGEQGDGSHTILADRPIGVTVSGFNRFISYGYPAAMIGLEAR